jgi:two-component system sensor histidine kinase QseC
MSRRPSLQRQLLAWTLGALLLVWFVFIAVGYRTGVEEADELTDGHLASVAALLLSQPTTAFIQRPDAARLGIAPALKAHDYQQSLSVTVWDRDGAVLARTGPAPLPAFDGPEGFSTVTLGEPAQSWRVFARWDDGAHVRRIAVLLSMQERDDLVEDIAEQIALPGLWLLPIVALVLVLAVRRGLQPLMDLSARVHRLDIHHADRLQAPPHTEFQAMTGAIETLAARYQTALVHERELASTFAHELRTPLASLSLHASSLQGSLSPEQRRIAVEQVSCDATRTAAIMDDLLALARAGRAQLAETAQPVDLAALARRIAAEYAQAAFAGAHDLSVEAPEACVAPGHLVLLEIALRNLVGNALGHTPPGTVVEIRVLRDPPSLQVWDDARLAVREGRRPAGAAAPTPGLGLGLGLGHQVVRRVADVHAGRFDQVDDEASGWRGYRLTLAGAPDPDPPARAQA